MSDCNCIDVDGKPLNLCGSDLCQLLRSGHNFDGKIFVRVNNDDEDEDDE